MVGKGIIIGSIIVLALLSAGTFLLLNSLTPLDQKHMVLNDTFNVAANSYENRTAWVSSSGEYVASFIVSEGTINASWVPTVELWLEGKFKPDWYETDQTDMRFSVSLGQENEKGSIDLVFLNNGTITKEVHLEVSKVWEETNYVNLFGGATLVLLGTIITILLKYKR